MKKFRLFAIAVAALLLAGCATQPVPDENARSISEDHVLDTQFLKQVPGTGEVTIIRDSGTMGSTCAVPFYVDGEPIAEFRTMEKLVLFLPAGSHILSVRLDGFCGRAMSEIETLIKADHASKYRIGWGADGILVIKPTAF
jgi:hypothetical protein